MHGICIKIEFDSQRRERLLFLYTNMAAVTSRENDLLFVIQHLYISQFLAASLEDVCKLPLRGLDPI